LETAFAVQTANKPAGGELSQNKLYMKLAAAACMDEDDDEDGGGCCCCCWWWFIPKEMFISCCCSLRLLPLTMEIERSIDHRYTACSGWRRWRATYQACRHPTKKTGAQRRKRERD
jgi:hypothetical protein